jgi:hypothetical protein
VIVPITKSPLSRYVGQMQANSPRSRRLDWIAGYFRFTAIVSGAAMILSLALAATHWATIGAAFAAHPLAFAFWPVNVAGWWWTGKLIAERQRMGAWMAMSSIGFSILTSVVAHRPGAWFGIAIGVLGLASIASAWDELE